MTNEIKWQHKDKSALWQAISNAQFALDMRIAKDQSLDTVVFDVQDNCIVIHLTQVESMLEQKIAITQSEGVGKFAVSLSTLYDILKNLPDGQELTLSFEETIEGKKLHVKYPRGCFRVCCFARSEQLHFARTDLSLAYEIKAKDLYSVLLQTAGFMGDDSTCVYLNGVYMQKKPHGLVFVATDAHRLLHRKLSEETIKITGTTDCEGFLIPRKAVMTLQKLLSNSLSRTIQIGFNSKQMQCVMDGVLFVTNVLEGEFPDYESVLLDPEKAQEHLMINNVESFLKILERVMCIARRKSSMISLLIKANEPSWIEVSERDIGTAKEEFKIEGSTKEHEIDFNGRYLLDMIKCINCSSVCLHFYDRESQVIFTSEQDPGLVGLLMPMCTI